MENRNDKMLVRIGCGDAGALSTEYVPHDDPIVAKTLMFNGYEIHPTHQNKPGDYSDDTEMSAANTRVILGEFGQSQLGFAMAWLAEFQRGGFRDGYSRGFQSLLENVDGNALMLLMRLKALDPKTKQPRNRSTKNGAAMRSVPFGAMAYIKDMLELVSLQAAITHDTTEGLVSAQSVALMSHYSLYSTDPLKEIGSWCLGQLPVASPFSYIFTEPWTLGRVKAASGLSVGIATVWAVAHLLRTESSLMAMMRQLIKWGGDTDSVAAIVWGIASARFPNEVLPEFYERDLESGLTETGTPYLLGLGKKLMDKFA